MRPAFVDERTLITTTSLPVTGKPLYLFPCERKDLKTYF